MQLRILSKTGMDPEVIEISYYVPLWAVVSCLWGRDKLPLATAVGLSKLSNAILRKRGYPV